MKRIAGFTLVELLVALSAMALLAALGWRGLDAIARAQALTNERADEVMVLRAALAQWSADLDAMAQLPQASTLEWDGRALRIVRRGMAGLSDKLYVVAWTQREGQWLRWQSAPLATRGEVQGAWRQAGRWGQLPGDEERLRELSITPLVMWQLFYFRNDSWSHPLSSDAGATSAPGAQSTAVVPDGVRLVLTLPPGQAMSGHIVRDWVSPRLGGARS